MPDFKNFANAVSKNFDKMSKGELFVVDLGETDLFYDVYIPSFPEGTNEIFRERTFHDGSYDRHFVRRVGNVVAIDDSGNIPKIVTIWDNLTGDVLEYHHVVAKAMSDFVRSRPIMSVFRTSDAKIGVVSNKELLDSGEVIEWNHFNCNVDKRHIVTKGTVGEVRSSYESSAAVFKRGLEEIGREYTTQVLDLIHDKMLYRGNEHKERVKAFHGLKKAYDYLPDEKSRDAFVWQNAGQSAARFRNTVIGTLATDLAKGVELEKAVKSFESKVAPENYKRPKALITKKMVDSAVNTLKELDMEHAVERRLARASDMNINDVLFVDSDIESEMIGGSKIADLLSTEVKKEPVKIESAKKVSIEDFMNQIVPRAKKIEALVENDHQPNFMTLTAPQHGDSGGLFNWNNDFAWSYNGDIADSSLRQAVVERGGSVTGAFRFTHSWNHEKRNASLMDLHVFMPGNHHRSDETLHETYGRGRRVGWNLRKDPASGGVQDVDYTNAAPVGYVPVENITFPDINRMPEGKYICKVHNWNLRNPTKGGFKAEIEFEGQVFQYEYDEPLRHHEWVTVAHVTLANGKFDIDHKLPVASEKVHEKWGVHTKELVKVKTILNSPNHWENSSKTGNKHTFFILDGCQVDEPVRGIYNEFLNPKLHQHRKVFEVLGDKTKCVPDPDQLSGLGFSDTKKATLKTVVTTKDGRKEALEIDFS